MLQDIRYGIRMLLKKPGFTLVAVLSLALGIGANTAIFSLLDAVLIRKLPVQQPEQLVLFGRGRDIGVTLGFPDSSWDLFSYSFYRQAQQRTDVFAGVASLLSMQWNVHGFVNTKGPSSDIEQMQVQLVSGTYFPVLGINAALGRVLTDADDQTPGAHPVAVASYAWWENRLGRDPSAVGKTINIDGIAYTIVGVAPKEFFGTTVGQAPDLWIPLAMEKQMPPAHFEGRTNEKWQALYLIGRLKNGVTAEQANSAVNLLFTQSLQARAGAQPAAKRLEDIKNARVQLTPVGRGLSQLREEFSLSLKVLMGVVALVLLIASANVANLLLAHGAARTREFAVRLAVGAGRMRVVGHSTAVADGFRWPGSVAGRHHAKRSHPRLYHRCFSTLCPCFWNCTRTACYTDRAKHVAESKDEYGSAKSTGKDVRHRTGRTFSVAARRRGSFCSHADQSRERSHRFQPGERRAISGRHLGHGLRRQRPATSRVAARS